MKRIFCLAAFVMIFAAAAFADIRLPDTPTPKPTATPEVVDMYLNIRLDKSAEDATLVIPKDQLGQLRSQLAQLDGDSSVDSNAGSAGLFTRTQTIVSGMFLSLAMIFGGVWMARGRKSAGKINKTVAAGAILFFVGSAATIAFANAGPPRVLRSITGKLFNKKTFGSSSRAYGKIKVQVVGGSGPLTLTVPDNDKGDNDEEE